MTILFVGTSAAHFGEAEGALTYSSFFTDSYAGSSIVLKSSAELSVDVDSAELWSHVYSYQAGAANLGSTFTNAAGTHIIRAGINYARISYSTDSGTSFTTLASGTNHGPAEYVDVHFKTGVDGFVKIYVNEALFLEVSQDFSAFGNIAKAGWTGGTSVASSYFSGFAIADEPTLGFRVASLTPNSNTAQADWSGSYANIANTAGSITSSTTGDQSTFGVSDLHADLTSLTPIAINIGIQGASDGTGVTQVKATFGDADTGFLTLPVGMSGLYSLHTTSLSAAGINAAQLTLESST